jgi:hypothetical protein
MIDSRVDLDNGEDKINWESLESSELKLNGKSVEITKSGNYTLSGYISNGSIVVNTSGDVKLIFNGVSISSDDGPAILIVSSNNVIIELKEDTKNYVSDSSTYSNLEYNGCIHSMSDLIFQGDGYLEVNGNYNDGIVSKDDLKFDGGKYKIKSVDDGIVGKDSVYIVNGNFSLECNGDGIKSSNIEDNTKGFINIDNGKIDIISGQDGMQAESKLIINNGDISIKTRDGYKCVPNYSVSSKGLKSEDNLVIKDGNIVINSCDDGIHSNNYVGIVNGNIHISSGDDAIRANKEVIIDNGYIDIKDAYEGIEAEDVTINGGEFSILVSDDGLNISGGLDESYRGGLRDKQSNAGGTLVITGGKLYIKSIGDGVDVNGNIIMSGGEVYIDGPIDTDNGAVDYDKIFDIRGGVFFAVGTSVMAQTTSDISSQYSVMFYLDKMYSGKLTLVDSNGNNVFSFNPSKRYSSVVISNSSIRKGEEYDLVIDGKKFSTLKVDKINSVFGSFVRGVGTTVDKLD